jgi:hypothetical protein
MSRRQALGRLGAGALLAAGLWPGALTARAGSGENGGFRFITANDLHCTSPQCGIWLEQVVRQMKGEGAELCLLCGDLTDRGEREHMGTVRKVFRGLGVPAYTVPGNHDWITPTSRRSYERVFPGRLNYWFEHRGWQFVGLDTTEGQRWQETRIQPATLRWLDRNLRRLDPRKPTVLFTHFPLGEAVSYRPLNAEALLNRFAAFNLRGVCGGHWHGYTVSCRATATVITGPCCALRRDNHDRSTAKGYLVYEAREGVLTHRFVPCRVPQGLATQA